MTAKASTSGIAIIISAPSGAGKTTLVAELLKRVHGLELSVSHSTRKPRDGEIDGTHYHFVSVDQFESHIATGDMLEYADVFGNYYGTSHRFVAQRLTAGADVILEIDWQGAAIAREKLPDAISIMILPPSRDALSRRLVARGKDSAEVIQNRLRQARTEMSHMDEFDYLVVNENFHMALEDLTSIVIAQRLRTGRQRARNAELLDALLAVDIT